MEELIAYQMNLLPQVNGKWYRYLFGQIHMGDRLLAIKGIRGVGKTTLLLQHLVAELDKGNKGLYVTAEHPYFYRNTLFDLAAVWYSYGGRLLFIDEVHKYAAWSRELKLIYDGFPSLKVLFTSSSALDLYRGESDLSRRLETKDLPGLSFREYISLMCGIHLDPVGFEEILKNPVELPHALHAQLGLPVLPLFKEYLKQGYFPFVKELRPESIPQRLFQVINTVLESDLSFIQDYSAANVTKIKQLLGVIAESVPFEPNISKIAARMRLGRQTVNIFIKHLEDAKVLNLLFEKVKGISQLQKPSKIYFENPNFVYALQPNPSIGTVRETFFMNQLRNSGYSVTTISKGDFLVDGKYAFEIGGRNKDFSQIRNHEHGYLVVDDIEIGFGRKIPLWVFGFLY